MNSTKKTLSCILISTFILLSASSTISSAQSATGIMVDNGDHVIYDISTTATYRMYGSGGRKILLNVTDNSTFPIKGDYSTVVEEGGEWVTLNKSNSKEDVNLIPYFINSSDIGPEKCPYEDLDNTSRSYIVENWNEDNLQFNQEGEAYADRADEYFILTFEYKYYEPNRLNDSYMDHIVATCSYTWDHEFGVLLKQSLQFDNLNDSSMDGTINYTIRETSLWSLQTGGGIPSYPVNVLLPSGLTVIIGIYIVLKKKTNLKSKKSKEDIF